MSHRFSGQMLAKAREASVLSRSELALKVGADVETVRHWEAGHSVPNPRSLLKLATALNVPVDALHEDSPAPLRLKDLRRWSGLTQAELGRKLHTSATMVSNWERGRICFPPEQRPHLAAALGVGVETVDLAITATYAHLDTGQQTRNRPKDTAAKPHSAPGAPPNNGELGAGTESMLSTLDSYIKALDEAEKRFVNAAASGDQDKENDAADDLAALVRQFVDYCNNCNEPSSAHNETVQHGS